MTNPAILDALAARMWKAQAENSGTPASVSLGRTPELFATQSEETRSSFLRYAAAVLELVGPKPLVWASIPITKEHEGLAGLWLCSWGPLGQYQVHMFDTDPSHVMLNGPDIVPTGIHGTIEAAQAAAQAHADAAHWANTNIGGE